MREWTGVVWGFSWLGATGWRFCRKTQKEPAKCLYSVCILCTVYYFPPCGWNLCQVGRQFLSVESGRKVLFGWLSAISQLASRVGEGGGVGQLCLHSVKQPCTTWPRWREQGGGLRYLPLVDTDLWDSLAPLLPILCEDGGLLLQLVDNLRRHACTRTVPYSSYLHHHVPYLTIMPYFTRNYRPGTNTKFGYKSRIVARFRKVVLLVVTIRIYDTISKY